VLFAEAVSEQAIRAGDTRVSFWHFPVWLEVFWYCLAIGSVFVFAYGVAKPVAKFRQGQGGSWPPRRELPGRLRDALRIVGTQVTVARRDRYAGVAHTAILYGFVTLFVGTVVLAINTDVTERFFGWRFFQGGFYRGYSIVLDVMGIALLAGILAMMLRRGVIRPRKLDYTRPDRGPDDPGQRMRRRYRWGDWVFVGGLLYLVVTGYLVEGMRIAMDHPQGAAEYSSGGWVASHLFTGIPTGTMDVLRMGAWWGHGLVALTLVAAIPYTKATHMLTSFASLVLRDPLAGKRLRVIPPRRADEPAGYGVLRDFSPLHLLQLDACTKCGKCHEACPALASGKPLSPRDVVLELREEANAAFASVGVGGVLGSLLARGDAGAAASAMDVGVIGPQRVRTDTIWSCMQCNACVEACPVGIEQAPMINQLRRRLVEDGDMPNDLQATLQAVQRSGNSFGENKRRRGRWTKELDFEVVDARKQAVDVLWFVGDYASFDPRSQDVSRTLARLLQAAEVDFGILYDGERNAGNDVRRAGEEGLWEALAQENIATLNDCDFQRIVTSDPHSLNTLRNEYPELGGTWPVFHHTGLLLDLLRSGRLEVRHPLDLTVTYHDPCYLGRHNDEYEAPREILRLLGCTLIEMPRNRDNSFCCGAGGGRIWIRDEPGAERPSENRIQEATSLDETVELFVVACPKDVTMYEDAIKTTGHGDDLALRELTELIEQAVLGPPIAAAGATAATGQDA
jgi:Fe-S oxidoreductase